MKSPDVYTAAAFAKDYVLFPSEIRSKIEQRILLTSSEEWKQYLLYELRASVNALVAEQLGSLQTAEGSLYNPPDLVIVGGHASLNSDVVPHQVTETGAVPALKLEQLDLFDESTWLLNRAYQDPAEVLVFVAHILALLETLKLYPSALGVFSGGSIRKNPVTGQPSDWTEAESYLAVAKVVEELNQGDPSEIPGLSGSDNPLGRVLLEPTARGTVENIVNAILQYNDDRGEWPRRVILYTWGFKADASDMYQRIIHECYYSIPKEVELRVLGVGDLADENRRAGAREDNRKRLEMELGASAAEMEGHYAKRESPGNHLNQSSVIRRRAA